MQAAHMTRRAIAVLAVALGAAAFGWARCTTIEITDPGPLTVSLTATPGTAAVGATVTFRFEASGTQLETMTLIYGDGALDTIPTLLARTAQGNRAHSYAAAGTYMARLTVRDASQGLLADTVNVQITPAGVARRPAS